MPDNLVNEIICEAFEEKRVEREREHQNPNLIWPQKDILFWYLYSVTEAYVNMITFFCQNVFLFWLPLGIPLR